MKITCPNVTDIEMKNEQSYVSNLATRKMSAGLRLLSNDQRRLKASAVSSQCRRGTIGLAQKFCRSSHEDEEGHLDLVSPKSLRQIG